MKYLLLLVCFAIYAFVALSYIPHKGEQQRSEENAHTPQVRAQNEVTPTPATTVKQPPVSYTIPRGQFISQSFNNCGPASLSMLFTMYGENISQAELAEKMRPFNNPAGGVDDKSVFPEEFVVHAESYGYKALHRPNGNVEMMKKFVANDIPVIVRTWLALDDDIGHYRIIKGYNETTQSFIQDDSYQGANLVYSYDNFLTMWKPYNYEYVIVYPENKQDVVTAIVGEDIHEKKAWQNALKKAENDLKNNPEDVYARFDVAIASYHVGNSKRTIEEFEKVQFSIAPKTLWYQLEPFKAYIENKEYEKFFALTEQMFANGNLAYSELYHLRGLAYKEQGNTQAEAEFAKAYQYNKNFDTTKKALRL